MPTAGPGVLFCTDGTFEMRGHPGREAASRSSPCSGREGVEAHSRSTVRPAGVRCWCGLTIPEQARGHLGEGDAPKSPTISGSQFCWGWEPKCSNVER